MDQIFEANDLEELEKAVNLLENTGFLEKALNIIGAPVEYSIKKLPAAVSDKVILITRKSLEKALKAAVSSMKRQKQASSDKTHKLAAAISGGAGGFFGLPALAVELPLSTTIMLRSIADIARSHGEILDSPESQLSCLEVFSLGGRNKNDDAMDSSYFLTRYALANTMAEAAEHLAAKEATKKAAPVLVRFITQITERFGVQVSEKVLLQTVPVIGALGGATVNTVFIGHFQNMAKGHFTVRALERKYGKLAVKEKYMKILKNL